MSALALPYVQVPTFTVDLPLVGSHTLTIFGPLVALGIVVGFHLSQRYATARRLDPRLTSSLISRVAIVGLVAAHWVSIVVYYPGQLLARPWVLIDFTSGLSSVGGFFGGLGAFAWLRRRWRLDAATHADLLTFGLLAGFTIGRLGCTLVHDHPGAVTSPEAWLAVGPWPDGLHRYDLGLIELMGLLALCLFVYVRFDWRRAPPGQLTALVAILYGVGRFPLDFLRAADVRYLGLTPAQLASLAIVATGIWLWRRSMPATMSERNA